MMSTAKIALYATEQLKYSEVTDTHDFVYLTSQQSSDYLLRVKTLNGKYHISVVHAMQTEYEEPEYMVLCEFIFDGLLSAELYVRTETHEGYDFKAVLMPNVRLKRLGQRGDDCRIPCVKGVVM